MNLGKQVTFHLGRPMIWYGKNRHFAHFSWFQPSVSCFLLQFLFQHGRPLLDYTDEKGPDWKIYMLWHYNIEMSLVFSVRPEVGVIRATAPTLLKAISQVRPRLFPLRLLLLLQLTVIQLRHLSVQRWTTGTGIRHLQHPPPQHLQR